MRTSVIAIATLALAGIGSSLWAWSGIRQADERLAAAITTFESARSADKAEARRLTALESRCYQTAVASSADSARLSDPSAKLTVDEIKDYSSLYSSCLADDFLQAPAPLIDQARLFYSAALPWRLYQARMAPTDRSFDGLLERARVKQDEAFVRQLALAQRFRPLADQACSGFWGARACLSAFGGRRGSALRERYVLELIAQRETVEVAYWQLAHPQKAAEYDQTLSSALANNLPTPAPPWGPEIDALEERLKKQAFPQPPAAPAGKPAASAK